MDHKSITMYCRPQKSISLLYTTKVDQYTVDHKLENVNIFCLNNALSNNIWLSVADNSYVCVYNFSLQIIALLFVLNNDFKLFIVI